ncbi:Kinetochore protein mis18, partial [Globisporangium splendens]
MARKRAANDSGDDADVVVHVPAVRKRDRRAESKSQRRPSQQQKEPSVHAVAVRKAPRSSSQRTVTVTPDQIIPRGYQQDAYAYNEEDEVTEEDEEEAHTGVAYTVEEPAVESEESDEEEEEEEIAAPVVFQCGTCRSIFGDSYSFVGSNADLLLVTLSAVTNITTARNPQTSKEGMDKGSTFQELLCAQCQTVLGCKYVTTSVPLDPIRGLYSFATNTIASYQLGYPQLSAEANQRDTSGDTITQATIACDQAVKMLSADHQEVLKLREDMTKVQNLLLVVDERLHHLETDEPESEAEEELVEPTQTQKKRRR